MEAVALLPAKVELMEARLTLLGEQFKQKDHRREEENRATECQWGDELHCLELSWEERQEEQGKSCKAHAAQLVQLDKKLDEALKGLQLNTQRESWVRELEHQEQVRQEEMKQQLQDRPTHAQMAGSYTILTISHAIVDQIDKQLLSLQASLHTVEKLYLRQLEAGNKDKAGPALEDTVGQLQEILHRWETSQPRPGPSLPALLDMEAAIQQEPKQETVNMVVPSALLFKGTPHRHRAASGPANLEGWRPSMDELGGEGFLAEGMDWTMQGPLRIRALLEAPFDSPWRTQSRTWAMQALAKITALSPLPEASLEMPIDPSPLTQLLPTSFSEYINLDGPYFSTE
ncbi:hypothetical protein BYT27DRAFT_7264357 [Phlegmacium glaucopus]|nr:hypothetical protein BYT27DRAFT_7264357 [Phlegmacium glaucopus]